MKKLTALAFGIAVAVSLTGCGSLTGGKRIIRVSHALRTRVFRRRWRLPDVLVPKRPISSI